MDVVSVVSRVLLRQWWVLVICALAAVGVAVVPDLSHKALYESTARLSVSDEAPRSAQEAAAQISSVRAVATSTSVVANALQTAHIDRDATKVAREDVSVSGLGTSPIASLSVRDADPAAARRIAQALTDEVVTEFSDQQTKGLLQLTKDLDSRIVNAQSVRARLLASLGNQPTTKQRADLAELDAELTDLRAQRAAAARTLAGASSARLVDGAGVAEPAPSSMIPDAALALVLGGLLGLALVAARELARPSVRGADELAAHFGVPVLGHFSIKEGDVAELARTRQIAARVFAAATRAGIERVVVVGEPDVDRVAEISVAMTQLYSVAVRTDRLVTPTPARTASAVASTASAATSKTSPGNAKEQRPPQPRGGPAPMSVNGSGAPTMAVLDEFETPLLMTSRRSVGVVVMTPEHVRSASLRPAAELVTATDWPVIGVITYRRDRSASEAS